MHKNMQPYYSRNKFFLSQIGVWPYQPKILKVLLPCLIMFIQISCYITEILLLHDTWGDFNMTVEAIVNLIILTGTCTKLINITSNNNQFREVLQLMDHHWRLFKSQRELDILRYYAGIGYKVTKYYSVIIYILTAIFLSIPLVPRILDVVIPLNESRRIIFVVENEYRVDKEKYFYPILIHGSSGVILCMLIMVVVDTMYIVCVLHGCSLFSAIGYIEILDSTFTYATFVLLVLNVMIMSLVGIQVINKLGRTEEVIRFGFIVVGSFFHLFCLCFPGQLLMDHSAEVFDKAYSSRWYAFSAETKSLLKILLYRSFVPCTLSAGKMYVMSMTMCSSVIQTAMSYFTAFLSMR